MLNFKQICWCNAYVGSTKNYWNNNMSLFIAGIKLDVCFFKLNFIILILRKVINIIKVTSKYKRRVLFIVPELVLIKSLFITTQLKKGLNNNKITNFLYQLRNLVLVTVSTWIFGYLTNYKQILIKNSLFSVGLPHFIFILLNRITENSDYALIAREGVKLGLLVIGLSDSNQNPYTFDYAIPSNSKSFDSIMFYYKFFICYFYINNIKLYNKYYNNLIFNNFLKLKKRYSLKKKKK